MKRPGRTFVRRPPDKDVAIASTALGPGDRADDDGVGSKRDPGSAVASEGEDPGFGGDLHGVLEGFPEVTGGGEVD